MPILAVATGKEFNGNEKEIASIENAKFNCGTKMLSKCWKIGQLVCLNVTF